MSAKNVFFRNFAEFWHYTRSLSKLQREAIFNILPSKERDDLKKSYEKGGWEDVFYMDLIDSWMDDIKKQYGLDLIGIKCKVLHGKSVYVNKKNWHKITEDLKQYDEKYVKYVIGGIVAKEEQENTLYLSKGQYR